MVIQIQKLLYGLARRSIGAEECTTWAIDRLISGDDTPSLRLLATLDSPDADEVETHLQGILTELGVGPWTYRSVFRQEWETPPLWGFWWSDTAPELPHPRDYVDPTWDPVERARVIAYLDEAYIAAGYLGWSWCRMGCPGVPLDIGTRDLTDGTWIFPEGLAHYLRHHAVRPVEEFLAHVRQNNYHVPELPMGAASPSGITFRQREPAVPVPGSDGVIPPGSPPAR